MERTVKLAILNDHVEPQRRAIIGLFNVNTDSYNVYMRIHKLQIFLQLGLAVLNICILSKSLDTNASMYQSSKKKKPFSTFT